MPRGGSYATHFPGNRPAVRRRAKAVKGGHKWVPIPGAQGEYLCACGVIYRQVRGEGPRGLETRRFYWLNELAYLGGDMRERRRVEPPHRKASR